MKVKKGHSVISYMEKCMNDQLQKAVILEAIDLDVICLKEKVIVLYDKHVLTNM